jgi:hypothetical protein
MIFDRFGFELAHQVFAGRQNDGKSRMAVVAKLQQILGPEERSAAAKRLIILDGGVVNDSWRGRAAYRKEFVQAEGFVAIERCVGQSAGAGADRPRINGHAARPGAPDAVRPGDGKTGAELILPHSPQAKGREKRCNGRLGGTVGQGTASGGDQ